MSHDPVRAYRFQHLLNSVCDTDIPYYVRAHIALDSFLINLFNLTQLLFLAFWMRVLLVAQDWCERDIYSAYGFHSLQGIFKRFVAVALNCGISVSVNSCFMVSCRAYIPTLRLEKRKFDARHSPPSFHSVVVD